MFVEIVLVVLILLSVGIAEAATGFKEDFSNTVLNSSWQVVSGQGRYSSTDNPGYLKYYFEGSRGSMGGWRNNYQASGGWNPSLTLIRPFDGEKWNLTAKVNYNLRAHISGSSTGAQGQSFWIAFGEGTNDYLNIYRGVDWWYSSNVYTMELVSNGVSVANFKGTPSSVGSDGWVREGYWYEITRNGENITVRFSNDGISYTNAFSGLVAESVTATQRAIIDMNLYNSVGSYVDWDYIQVTPTKGAISVTTNLASATFSVTGASSYSGSGTSWSTGDAPAGTYTITYGTVPGYNALPSETKTLTAGESITFGGTYIVIPSTKGTISVTTNLADATFSVTGASSYSGSGTSWNTGDAPAGTYMITYGTMQGYNAPSSETKTLSAGGSIAFSGTYLQSAVTPKKDTTSGKFRVGPSVTLRPVTDVIEANQDGVVELFMNNPSLNDVTLNVDARVSVPSGIHVYGESFGQAAGAGVVAGTFSVPPGTSRTIILTIKADRSARIGSHTIQFTGLYYPDENKDAYNPMSLTYSITVKEPSNKPEEPPKDAQANATPSKTPGFGVVIAIFGVFAIARLLSRK
ncbi:MAG: hypothetical protein KKD46_04495 [Euryarchaeota archaeon]|nr:hypothetical protein [Euryarchaeota archaeon]